jgi:D-tyrosyl-tRNA(Tyr) deacylase
VRAVVQRVSRAEVRVAGEVTGRIGRGLLVLLGAANGDDDKDVDAMVDKCVNLRIFEDDAGKMNRSLLDVGGGLLGVSQFTLLGDARKGRRPSFIDALEPARAEALYERFLDGVRAAGVAEVGRGRFGAMMEVDLVNWGPVTILLDSRRAF